MLVLTGAGESFLGGHGPEGIFPRDRRPRATWPCAARSATPTAGSAACAGSRSRHRHGQRLVLRAAPSAPLFSCDLAIASEAATFGVSEINWGIIPGGNVTKVAGRADERP
ncbi:MAG: hypothetical protein WDN45_06220 [Caulobacteraceae bacterium]